MEKVLKAFVILVCGVIICTMITPSGRAADGFLVRMAATTWEPFMYLRGDVQKGIDYEIAQRVADKMNFRLTMRHCPFKRCLKEMSLGRLDLQSGIAYNEERAKYITYLKPSYGEVAAKFYTRKGEGHVLERYEDLYKIRVGMVAESHYFEPFNSDENINKFSVPKEEMLFALLEKGRIDAIIGTSPNLEFQIKKYGHKGKFDVAPYRPKNNIPLYFGVSKHSPLKVYEDRLNYVLLELKETGEIDEILARYR